MMNSSLGDLEATENYYGDNNTSEFTEQLKLSPVEEILFISITLITCSFGLVGNGYIIWLLGFQMKRNRFTTFILNLAIADFGFLTCTVIDFICELSKMTENLFNSLCAFLSDMMFVNSHFLMTAISIDRCVAVLFPIWHRCSRPKHLSPAVCIILWASTFLLPGFLGIMIFTNVFAHTSVFYVYFLVTSTICLLLITLSTVVLFLKVCHKSNQKNQGQILMMVLITLLCFLILSFPLSVTKIILYLYSFLLDKILQYLNILSTVLSCLNSSMNPVIYFLVGKKKGAQSKESMKVILQNVFKEGEATRGR
ncbi:mas-related G-protein coupled receptor member H-like [Vipera latastei]